MITRRVVARSGSWLLSNLGLVRFVDLINKPVGGCIICYHHISAKTLEEQLKWLSRWYAIVSLDELILRLGMGKSTAGLMSITFDDGFADELESGSALARKYGWPMTFYLATELVSSGQPYWFEEVGPLLQAAPGGAYQLGSLSFRLGGSMSRRRARNLVVRHLFHRTLVEISRFMEELRRALFGSGNRRADVPVPSPISWHHVKELSRVDEVAFEAHSVTHPFFCTLSLDEIRREMEDSKRKVEEVTGREVRHFCYPYGDEQSIGSQAPQIAGQLFRSATTIIHGRCRRGMNRAMLPRIPLFGHDTAAMASWRVGITR